MIPLKGAHHKMTNNKYINSWINEMAELTQPDSIVWIDGSEEQTELLRRNRDQLTEGLTEEQKALLDEYDDRQNELSATTEKNAFVQGVCLGMRLLAAATYTRTGE